MTEAIRALEEFDAFDYPERMNATDAARALGITCRSTFCEENGETTQL